MSRIAVLAALALTACGAKNGASLCDEVPPPAACSQTCDPGGGTPACPSGYHCTSGGTCGAECTQGGTECGAGMTCSATGTCQPTGGGSGADANCPAVHFAPMPTTPSVELILDRSGSMNMSDISPTRYGALQNALVGTMGVVKTEQAKVYFGAALFSGDQAPCLNLSGFTVPRALNNFSAIQTLINTHSPGGSTPTADAITMIHADFGTNPPPAGSPPIILLATDGEPNSCNNGPDNGLSVAATKAAYNAGIRLFIIGLAGVANQFLQDMANAGAGVQQGQPNAPYYTANDPTTLAMAFNQIIGGVLSCDLQISGMVDPATASQGTLTLDGMVLTYGTDWTVDANGKTIHILGAACTKLKGEATPVVDASFPCGVVII